MNITFSKLDPTCYNILPINWNEEPTASLSTVNINFSALDAEVCNLGYKAENFWDPLYDIYESNRIKWDSAYQTLNSMSACWQSAYLTVHTSSASWLTPITVIYPFLNVQNGSNPSQILTWIRANFPVTQGGCRYYLNGQQMYVNILEYSVAAQSVPCSCGANTEPVTRRVISATITVTCPCTCSTGYVNCYDRYTSKVAGIAFHVVNDQWQYLRYLQ